MSRCFLTPSGKLTQARRHTQCTSCFPSVYGKMAEEVSLFWLLVREGATTGEHGGAQGVRCVCSSSSSGLARNQRAGSSAPYLTCSTVPFYSRDPSPWHAAFHILAESSLFGKPTPYPEMCLPGNSKSSQVDNGN